MAMAFDLGVTHFDIARSYGFGDAEGVLGEFAAQTRTGLTITSKFGVVPPDLKPWQRIARPALRIVRNRAKLLQKAVKNKSGKLLSERCYDSAYARSCLETSLRCLGRDHIDFYLLHEPDIAHLVGLEDLRAFLDDRVAEGKVGRWGVAFPKEIPDQFPERQWGSIVQCASRIEGSFLHPQPAGAPIRFVTRPLGGGSVFQSTVLLKTADLLGGSLVDAAFAIAGYQAGSRGAVIAGMFDTAHIQGNVASMMAYLQHKDAIDQDLGDIFRGRPLD